jgi:hypothetical protein
VKGVVKKQGTVYLLGLEAYLVCNFGPVGFVSGSLELSVLPSKLVTTMCMAGSLLRSGGF